MTCRRVERSTRGNGGLEPTTQVLVKARLAYCPLGFVSMLPQFFIPCDLPPQRFLPFGWGKLCCLAVWAWLPVRLDATEIAETFEGPDSTWTVTESDVGHQMVSHARSRETSHGGDSCERIVLDASGGLTLRAQTPIAPASVIDEWQASLWVRANRPDIRVAVRVVLPEFISTKTGLPVEVLVPGTTSKLADRWELLEVRDIARGLEQQLPALHAQHGSRGNSSGARVTHLVVDLYSGPGRYDIAIDDMLVRGVIPAVPLSPVLVASAPSPAPPIVPPVGTAPSPPQPPSGLSRGVLEVAGLPFFPRALDYNGEKLETIATLGFNCVRLTEPAPSNLLDEAQRAGMWVICPPPTLPEVDIRDPESLPVFSANWDRVLLWDMGSGLAEGDVESLAERARRVRACDQRGGRPLIAAADSGLRSISRHVDLLVARRTVLGTSLELIDYLTWLRERPRLARPGTPLLATLSTEIDPRTAGQAAALSGVGGWGLAVDPESLSLASLAAVAAGTRGILFSSSRRIDGNDHESRARAAASQAMNLKLKLLEPWGAAGRFAAAAQSSDPEIQAVVLEAARARMVLVFRCVQGAQIVARHYQGDIPKDATPLSLLVPGVPEAHQAWEVSPGGLRPLKQKRVTGGVSIVLDSFCSSTLVLLSGEPAVTAHVQERVRELAPLALISARTQAGIALSDGAELLARLPPAAFGNLPATAMFSEAQRSALAGESLALSEPDAAIAKFLRASAIGGQLERLAWERGVLATGSMVASPLSSSDASLADHWRFVEALANTGPGSELLTGGGMEQIEDLAGNGWHHFALRDPAIRTAVEISRTQPASGKGSLCIQSKPLNPAESPVVVETPLVWITTPPISVPAGKLLEIQAQVWVPKAIKGSVDGLLVFDSLGGTALAERVGVTRNWRKLVLYRIVPADAANEPLVVTFALTGIGEARIDDVSVRVLERTAGTTGVAIVSTTLPSTSPPLSSQPFPQPSELLAPVPLPPVAGGPTASVTPANVAVPQSLPQTTTAPPSAAWPGMNLEWPKLPFGQSTNTPPPGPGGGTIDPFKRVRPAP